jgi:hypothetical protein
MPIETEAVVPYDGASGTDWWVDPKEELAVVHLRARTIRWHNRKKINALVYHAIID